MERIGILQEVVKKAMSCLMEGNHLLLAGRNDLALARNAHEALVPCLLEIVHVHTILGFAPAKEGCFVHEVGQIGARGARSGAGYPGKIHVFRQAEASLHGDAESTLVP